MHMKIQDKEPFRPSFFFLRGLSLWIGMAFILFILPGNAIGQDGYGRIDMADVVLIYHGGVHRPMEWTKEQFDPYVTYEDGNGNKNWLFDGFLFLEFKDGNGRGFALHYVDKNARRSEWEWLMDRHFGSSTAFGALDASIDTQIEELGTPPFKHKVIMGLPSPIPDQKDWGQLNNQ